MKVGELLKLKRKDKGYSLRQLAIKVGISHSTIADVERGGILKEETIKRIIRALSLNSVEEKEIFELLTLEKIPKKLKEELLSYRNQKQEIANFDPNKAESTIKIPLYDSISAGCGITNGQILDFINVPQLKNPEDCFAVVVQGDSMTPTIPDGSIIIVRKGEEIPVGKIGAFITDEGAVVKKVQRTKSETILISENSDYPPIVINKDTLGFYECGRVIHLLLNL